jgi:two-component sensor histidine kinase
MPTRNGVTKVGGSRGGGDSAGSLETGSADFEGEALLRGKPTISFDRGDDASALARAIVDTVREPLLVLDQDLRVIAASRSFYQTFKVNRQDTEGRLLYTLGNGQWDIPALRLLLEQIVPEQTVMEAYEVEQEFPGIGRRTMLLNARKVFYEGNSHLTLLLAIEDVTERRATERVLQDLLEQKDMLLQEMSHRVANSLQIIASILLLKARTVQSEETRLHLQDAHQRVMSVASVQQQLQASAHGESIQIGRYLSKLCESLAASMIGDTRPISLKVLAEGGTASSTQAVSLGLIVTELVINALKHAFPDPKRDGQVVVSYAVDGANWKLSVSDNGVGTADLRDGSKTSGLGTSLVQALAQQLEAQVEVVSTSQGTTVSITHATFTPRLPQPGKTEMPDDQESSENPEPAQSAQQMGQ